MVWEVKIRHEKLGKFRTVRDTDKKRAEEMASAQLRAWDDQWKKKLEADKRKLTREAATRHKEERAALALAQTASAESAIREIESTLAFALSIPQGEVWKSQGTRERFPKKRPEEPRPIALPEQPSPTDPGFVPKPGVWGLIAPSKRTIDAAQARFEQALSEWQSESKRVQRKNSELRKQYEDNLAEWKRLEQKHKQGQDTKNAKVRRMKAAYLACEPGSVVDYCRTVLSGSNYPKGFPRDHELEYHPDTKILVVNFSMPSIIELPSIKEVRYIAARDELKEIGISDSALRRMYDGLLYKMTLRTLYELFESDEASAIDSIVLNGLVESTDQATGKTVTACILSMQASKSEFQQLNLANVDPQACFRQLKGVGSSRLSGLTPIAPIIRIDKSDKRFAEHYEVADSIDDSTNIAAMDWQDFEHLIREVFEKEFSQGGGGVRVTRASRDGGVDAVAFDPDPIRGGKIVIQAKRYTNTVGLSAVRDLYGTVVNEGAMKGILVTTSVYGPDAYEFAKDKPLSLLSGSNLLHLLERHGHRARIDLAEAKTILTDGEQKN